MAVKLARGGGCHNMPRAVSEKLVGHSAAYGEKPRTLESDDLSFTVQGAAGQSERMYALYTE
jgi:hypothetical protein